VTKLSCLQQSQRQADTTNTTSQQSVD
jgi:hypothetical protein